MILRRLVGLVMVLTLGLSSAEVLLADARGGTSSNESAVTTPFTASGGTSVGPDDSEAPAQGGGEANCFCLCACTCAGAQVAVLPSADVAPASCNAPAGPISSPDLTLAGQPHKPDLRPPRA